MVDIATTDDGSIDYENATLDGKISLIAEAQGDDPAEIKSWLWRGAAEADVGDQDPEALIERAVDRALNDAFESLGKGRPWGDGAGAAAGDGSGADEATAGALDEYGTGVARSYGGSDNDSWSMQRKRELQAIADDAEDLEAFADEIGETVAQADGIVKRHRLEGVDRDGVEELYGTGIAGEQHGSDDPEEYGTGVRED